MSRNWFGVLGFALGLLVGLLACVVVSPCSSVPTFEVPPSVVVPVLNWQVPTWSLPICIPVPIILVVVFKRRKAGEKGSGRQVLIDLFPFLSRYKQKDLERSEEERYKEH